MDNAGNRAVLVLGKGIDVFAGAAEEFARDWNHGAAQRIGGILAVHEAGIVRGDADREGTTGLGEGGPFVFAEIEDTGYVGEFAESMLKLPAPVLPLAVIGLGIVALPEGGAGGTD